MAFLLIEWPNETPKKYSVVSSEKLEDGSLRGDLRSIIGDIVQIVWTRGKIYPGLVLNIGTEHELSEEADELAFNAANSPVNEVTTGRKRKHEEPKKVPNRRQRAETIENIVENIPQPLISATSTGNITSQTQENNNDNLVTNFEDKYRRLKEKYRKLRTKYRDLKESIELNRTTEVELYPDRYPDSNVVLPAADLAAIKLGSNKPTVLARNLFRRLFSSDELSRHSLFGKKCNANKNAEPLPVIDTIRRDAIIRYVLKEEGLDEQLNTGNVEADKIFLKTKKATKKEIEKSLSQFLREECKK
ncbi:uncharacterized protein LOC118439061 [Folsomia candida]|uniref:BEN domain-containing protein n=1 Tax=Folsomia candida TaxID=158441 RepID=A0A226D6H2_FOLCA|nr:uncharacterized protein LOC118439061 [Folsomia candida]OXA41145.1 hypothetical protein Fcan01_24096 [Folsomia candida]